MKEITIETKIGVFDSMALVPEPVKKLLEAAKVARGKAYAPYSNFAVGAALLLDNGEVITGNNQENASYPSGLCAERTALYYAGATYPKAKIVRLAIVGGTMHGETSTPVAPCGACRQAIAEYEIKQETPIEIYFTGVTGKVIKSNSLSNLLPLIFDKSQL